MPKKNEQSAAITSPDVRKKIIEKIRAVYPPLFLDEGNLNKGELEALLKDFEVNDVAKFEFRWAGKMGSKKIAFTPSKARLHADPTRGVDFDDTKNVVIEGENLEVLKLLQKSYYGQVKCIYIDPPYNIDGDFVYSDDYSEEKKAYWEQNGTFEGGVQVDTSRETSGRYHSNWLNMMHSRLLLARQLLRDDGVIFMSIDENEVHNLRKLADEIFGEENYSGEVIWKNSSKNDQSYVSIQHEYVLFYVKDKDKNKGDWKEKKEGLDDIYKAFRGFKKKFGSDSKKIHEAALEWYGDFPASNPITASKHYNWMDENGVYFAADISGPNFGQYRYDVTHPVTGKVCKEPASGWRFPETTMTERIQQNLVHFGEDETTIPNNKIYLKDTETQSLTSIKFKDGRAASNALYELLGGDYFSNPKDVDIIRLFIAALVPEKDGIILDFFGGSGTTAHAVMALNAIDDGNRKFILVQLPELIDSKEEAYKAGYRKISEITIERIKRAGKLIKNEKPATDVGFKVFTLATSLIPENLFTPDPSKSKKENLEALELHIAKSKQKLIADHNDNELLYEAMIKDGFDLNFKAEKLPDFTKNQVLKVTDGHKEALVCFDQALKDETIKALEVHKDKRFICLHRAVDTTKKWGLDKIFGDSLSLI